jgi:NADH:ubiquinone reductase (non-electrogenic)
MRCRHTLLVVIFWCMTVSSIVGRRNNYFMTVASAFAPTALSPSTAYTTKSGMQAITAKTSPRTVLHSTNKNDDSINHGGSMKKQPHIVILGGGFGGINTALTLPTLPWSSDYSSTMSQPPKITLIDKSERFVFLPLLYELCVEDASLDEVVPTFTSLLDGGGGGIESVLSIIPELAGALAGFVIPRTITDQLFGKKDTDDDGDTNAALSFIQAKVEGIDVNNQQVVITKFSSDDNDGGGEIEYIDYDALVIATGSEISLDSIPGASKYALPFYTVEQALELKRRLALLDTHLKYSTNNNDSPINIVIVGGGYGGVELALNLVDRFGGTQNTNNNVNVSLVHRGKQVLEYATEHNRRMGIDRLASAGVKVMTTTSVVEILPPEKHDGKEMLPLVQQNQCIVQLSSAEGDEVTSLPTTLLLWTAGATPTSDRNMGIRNSILPRDSMGRILTSSTLNVPEYPNVFAIGDCSRPTKVPYPGTAQVAIQQATVASWNVFATLTATTNNNRRVGGGDDYEERGTTSPKLLPFKFISLGEMMTLGSEDATISTLGGNVELSGPVASWLRRWIYAVRMPTPRQALTAAVDGTGWKLARGAARRRKSKPVEWK